MQNFQRPKCPGLLDFSVAPTHSSLKKTTMVKMAEQNENTPHNMATDLDCLIYFTEYLVTLLSFWALSAKLFRYEYKSMSLLSLKNRKNRRKKPAEFYAMLIWREKILPK